MRTLVPIEADYAKLFALNPLAAEQFKNIVLIRLLEEAEAKLAKQSETREIVP